MKKLLSFLFLLIAAFALAGCSLLGGGGSGNGGNTTITVDFDEVFETISAQIPDKDNITADISLIRELGDVDITWTSSDESIISTRGRVARPDTDTEVILKCRLQANGITKEYTIKVLVRAEEVLQTSSIIDVINGETGKTYKVRGTVVAFSRINFILQDSTGYIISYFEKGVMKPVHIGDVLELEGVTSAYGGATQFNSPTYTLVGTEAVKQPTPRVLDAQAFDALNQSKIQIEYVELSGRLIKSGDYYNIQVPDATNVGSIAKPDNDLAEFIDKNVKVTGYFAYVSGGRYLYLVYTDIVLGDNTTPPIEVTTKTISEIKALGLSESCKLEGTVVATTNTSFVVKDETGLILVYADVTYAKDLNIGEKVKVEGITAEYGGIRQIANPEYEVIAEGSFTQPNPRVLDKDAFMALATKTEIEYIELEATLRKAGNYINLDVKDSTMKGSILACDKDFTEFIDKTVKVQGYFVYVSGSSTKYANIALINIALSENQNPETLTEVTLATVKSGTVGETYLSRGVVVATSAQSVLLKDASAYMYVYLGNTYEKDLNVGDEITVKGATSTYNGTVQFNRPTYEKVATSTVTDPTARVLSASDIDTLYTATTAPEVEFVEVTGIAKKSGNYLNVEFEGTTVQASIVYPEFDSATINNKQVKFTGYFLYNSKNSSGTFINIICTAYEEVGTVEPPVLESSLISTVIAGEVGATYKTQGTIIAMNKNSLVIDDASAKMMAYFAEGYDETLVIGDVVEVIGATTLYGGGVQFSSPELVKKEHTEYADPIANTLDADGFTALKQEHITIQYVVFSGVLKMNGSYANVEVEGSELIGSLTSKTIDFTAFDNKHIKVTGYFTNYSGSNGQYLTIIVTAIEEEVIEGNELFDEIKAEILAWNGAKVYMSMDLTTGGDNFSIVWRSSNEDVFSSAGVVTPQDEDVEVTLSATLTVENVTDTFTITVTVCAPSKISDLIQIPSTELEGTYATKGYVYAICNYGFLLGGEEGVMHISTDGQIDFDAIYVYTGSTNYGVTIGDEVILSGSLQTYNNIIEFTNIQGFEKTSNKKTINETYYGADADAINSLVSDHFMTLPVAIKGHLVANKNYINLNVLGTNNVVSILANPMNVDNFIEKDVIVKGYTVYVSGSSTKYLNIMIMSIELDENAATYALNLEYNNEDIKIEANIEDLTHLEYGAEVALTITKLRECNITSIKYNGETLLLEDTTTIVLAVYSNSTLKIDTTHQKSFELEIDVDAIPTNPMYAYGYYWEGMEVHDEVVPATVVEGKVNVSFTNIIPTFMSVFELADGEDAPNADLTNIKRLSYSFRAADLKEIIWQDGGSEDNPKDLTFVNKLFTLADGFFRMANPLHYVKATVKEYVENGEYLDVIVNDKDGNEIRVYEVLYSKNNNLRLSEKNKFVNVGDEIVFLCHIVNDEERGRLLEYASVISVNGEELNFSTTYTFTILNGMTEGAVIGGIGHSVTGEMFVYASVDGNTISLTFTNPQDDVYVCEYILQEGQQFVDDYYDYYRISEELYESGQNIIMHYVPDVTIDRAAKRLTVNNDGSWTIHSEFIVNPGIENANLSIIDIVPFGYLDGAYGEVGAYQEESIFASLTDFSWVFENGRYIADFTISKEIVDRYTKEYYYSTSYKGGIVIDYFGNLTSGNLDYTLNNHYMMSVFYFNSFLDSVETEGKGTMESPLTSADALAVAAFLPEGIWSNEYFYVEGIISDEVTDAYANFHLGEGDNAIYVYGCWTYDGQYRIGSHDGYVASTLIKTGDQVLVQAQVYHYVGKDGAITLELKDTKIIKINGEAYEYTLLPQSATTSHTGTYDDPYTSADALAVAAFLPAGTSTEDYYYISGMISDEVTADYANFHIGDGENAILVYGCRTNDGEYAIGSAYNHVASTLIKFGDLVLVQAKILHYVDKQGNVTLELTDTRIILINKQEYTYELIEVSNESATHAGTLEDPLDAKDAIILAAKLDAETKEKSAEKYYIKAVITSNPTPDYCNFNFTADEKNIVVYGLASAEDATQRYGSKRQIAELPVALGDEVVIYGQLQNYAGTLEVVSAQLIEVIKNN